MDFLYVFTIDVSIDFRGGNVRMAEEFLNNPDISAALEKMRCERMPKGVGADVLGDARYEDVFAEYLPETHPSQRTAAGVKEKHIACFSPREGRPDPADIVEHRFLRRAPEGNDTFF